MKDSDPILEDNSYGNPIPFAPTLPYLTLSYLTFPFLSSLDLHMLLDGWMDGWMDGWLVGWMDG